MAEEEQHIDTVDARAGTKPGIMRYVLGISLALIILIFVVVVMVGSDQVG